MLDSHHSVLQLRLAIMRDGFLQQLAELIVGLCPMAADMDDAWPFDQDVANPAFADEIPLGEDLSALGGGHGEWA